MWDYILRKDYKIPEMRANTILRDANDGVEQALLARIKDFIINGDRSQIERLVSSYRGGRDCHLTRQIDGGFNYCLEVRFDDDNERWILRFPKPGCAMQPIHKVYNEFAVMRFVAQHTTIPIPRAIACGVAQGELDWLGPYIIMQFVEGESLNELILDDKDKIKGEISERILEKIFRQIASILLQLSFHSFNKIGSLTMNECEDTHSWSIDHGPMTMKSNEIERMAGLKSDHLMRDPFQCVSSYLSALADQSQYYLEENPMSSDTTDEASSDYESIQILKSAIAMSVSTNSQQEHYLFNDDLRFGNILVDKDFNIVALIDWEFTYAAPSIFHQAPPWWIIGRDPFEWDEEDAVSYLKRLSVLIEFIREEEIRGSYTNILSTKMQQYWDDDTFWLVVALREYRFLEETMTRARSSGHFVEAMTITEVSRRFGVCKLEQRMKYVAEVLAKSGKKTEEIIWL